MIGRAGICLFVVVAGVLLIRNGGGTELPPPPNAGAPVASNRVDAPTDGVDRPLPAHAQSEDPTSIQYEQRPQTVHGPSISQAISETSSDGLTNAFANVDCDRGCRPITSAMQGCSSREVAVVVSRSGVITYYPPAALSRPVLADYCYASVGDIEGMKINGTGGDIACLANQTGCVGPGGGWCVTAEGCVPVEAANLFQCFDPLAACREASTWHQEQPRCDRDFTCDSWTADPCDRTFSCGPQDQFATAGDGDRSGGSRDCFSGFDCDDPDTFDPFAPSDADPFDPAGSSGDDPGEYSPCTRTFDC